MNTNLYYSYINTKPPFCPIPVYYINHKLSSDDKINILNTIFIDKIKNIEDPYPREILIFYDPSHYDIIYLLQLLGYYVDLKSNSDYIIINWVKNSSINAIEKYLTTKKEHHNFPSADELDIETYLEFRKQIINIITSNDIISIYVRTCVDSRPNDIYKLNCEFLKENIYNIFPINESQYIIPNLPNSKLSYDKQFINIKKINSSNDNTL